MSTAPQVTAVRPIGAVVRAYLKSVTVLDNLHSARAAVKMHSDDTPFSGGADHKKRAKAMEKVDKLYYKLESVSHRACMARLQVQATLHSCLACVASPSLCWTAEERSVQQPASEPDQVRGCVRRIQQRGELPALPAPVLQVQEMVRCCVGGALSCMWQ